MATAGVWLARCVDAQQKRGSFPEASFFRVLLQTDSLWIIADDWSKVYLSEEAAAQALPKDAQLLRRNGLELAASMPSALHCLEFVCPEDSTVSLRCDAAQVEHLRLFLKVAIVEQLLLRLHAGVDLEVQNPFARLRDFCGYFVLSALPVGCDALDD
eukprot:5461479-Pleurochrysis_carterae.AAC.1